MQSKSRSIASILMSILILSATAVALLSSIGAVSIGGYRPIVITSGSMQPSVSRGDLLLIKKSDDITVGDIITFRPLTGQIDSVTHRVVGIENGLDGISYLTKGDANTTTDVVPIPDEREGYVPNVVYSCGSLKHRDVLMIPFGIADNSIGFATARITDLLTLLTDSH